MISAKRITTLKAKHKAYILRTCAKDMSAHGGFVWPKKGLVSCPDWNTAPQCGGGLHGLLWGIGDGQLLDWDDGAKWLVVGIDEWVDLEGKVKTPSGEVVFCGKAADAVALLVVLGADPTKCVRGQATASGDYGQAFASGHRGQATASGHRGQATASGDYGQATASGYRGQATASGDYGQATASGDYGQATASGDYGQATASGHRGQATASGDYGQATASGDYGQATASGHRGQATASGYLGRAAAGPFGTLVFRWFDGERFRIVAAYVGEAGIEAGRYYRLNDAGEIIPTGEYIQKESK